MIEMSPVLKHQPTPSLVISIPAQSSRIPLKSLIFGAAMIACSSSSGQAATVAPIRMDAGTNGIAVATRQQDVEPNVSEALAEIKRRAGLTWGQIAVLLDVSRRTVHSWSNGASVRAMHAVRVGALLDHVRSLGELPAFKVRESVLDPDPVRRNTKDHAERQPPVLIGDTTPFTHQLAVGKKKMKVRRG